MGFTGSTRTRFGRGLTETFDEPPATPTPLSVRHETKSVVRFRYLVDFQPKTFSSTIELTTTTTVVVVVFGVNGRG